MNKNLTCNQVSALLNFYIEDKLSPRLKEYINMHLEHCPSCKKKVQQLQKILLTYKVLPGNENNAEAKPDNVIRDKLSAYIDNELNSNDNIKIKKMTISNPIVRKELESMYKFKRIIHNAYERTKNDAKLDYSKNILNKIQDSYEYTTNYFYKLSALFVVLITAIIVGFIYLYF